jgi:hypothetical protein
MFSADRLEGNGIYFVFFLSFGFVFIKSNFVLRSKLDLNHWDPGLCPSSDVLKTRRQSVPAIR